MAQEEHGAAALPAKGDDFRFAGGHPPQFRPMSSEGPGLQLSFRLFFATPLLRFPHPRSYGAACLSARRYQHIGHTPVHSQHYRASSAVPNSYLMLSSSAIRLATLSVHDYMTREPNFYAFGLLKVPTHMLPVSSVGLNIFRFLPNKLTESLLLQMPSD